MINAFVGFPFTLKKCMVQNEKKKNFHAYFPPDQIPTTLRLEVTSSEVLYHAQIKTC
jgi:hypothetical protein